MAWLLGFFFYFSFFQFIFKFPVQHHRSLFALSLFFPQFCGVSVSDAACFYYFIIIIKKSFILKNETRSADHLVMSDQIEPPTIHTHTCIYSLPNRERNRKYEAFSHSAATLHMRGDPIGLTLFRIFCE